MTELEKVLNRITEAQKYLNEITEERTTIIFNNNESIDVNLDYRGEEPKIFIGCIFDIGDEITEGVIEEISTLTFKLPSGSTKTITNYLVKLHSGGYELIREKTML